MNRSELEQHIRVIPDFPKAGVIFRDISPLLHFHFKDTIDALADLFSEQEWQNIDAIVGIESRGFILASGLAYAKNKGLLIARKPGKLPEPLHTESYQLEYGHSSLQMSSHFDGVNVLVVDDVLATGGTLKAACNLCERSGHTVVGVSCLINLKELNQFAWKDEKCRVLFDY